MAKAGRAANKGIAGNILGLLNPIRDPSLVVAIILTVIEPSNSDAPWKWVVYGLLNWIAVKALIWLLVNFFFSFVYLSRKAWWVFRNPRLAWRLLDALGTEEIIIGGLRPDMFATEDGGLHEGQLGVAGLGAAGYYGGPALGPGYGQNYDEGELYPDMDADRYGDYARGGQFSERLAQQGEELQEMLATYNKLISDWMGFTEEKWRAVSDSQLGWKPLRGRWNGWDEIYQDAWASSAEAAQSATETMARRFENARTKGSAASSVACFLHDVDSLRQSLLELEGGAAPAAPRMGGVNSQVVPPRTAKAPIIRNPMIVDADG
ncbi:MAG TPA: hypothetical protein VE338_01390 [Ktedonobacterales bacterium]|jgi:hypothetical protein|nr:hypothetical protein [Ktedonobacterales bacterium]